MYHSNETGITFHTLILFVSAMLVVLILHIIKQQVPENKRRESTLKGIVIGRRNAGINTTFRLRRLVAGVGVESVFPL
jgi:ribosomal protein L19